MRLLNRLATDQDVLTNFYFSIVLALAMFLFLAFTNTGFWTRILILLLGLWNLYYALKSVNYFKEKSEREK